MPKIIYYLDRLTPGRFYDDDELARLQVVYDRARQALAIDATDPRRETLALLIFEVAEESANSDELLSSVLALFRRRA